MSFVCYDNGKEVIITTPEEEAKVIKIWFVEGGRDLEEYDREQYEDEAVAFNARVSRF